MCIGNTFLLSDVLPVLGVLRLWVSDEFTATDLHIYSYFEKGCWKKCARANPQR